MYKRRSSGWTKHLDFTIIDLICMEMSFILAYFLRNGFTSPFLNPLYKNMAAELVLLHVFIVFFTSFYSGILKRGFLKEFISVIKYNCILFATTFTFLFATQTSAEYSRVMFFGFCLINIVLMYITHLLVKYFLQKSSRNGKNLNYMLLITKKKYAKKTAQKLQNRLYKHSLIHGIILVDQDATGTEIEGIPVVASRENMLEYVRTHIVDKVFIDHLDEKDLINEIANQLTQIGITVHINLNLETENMPNAVLESVGDFTLLTTSINNVTPRQMFVKRTIDILGGLAGLLATGIAFLIFAPIIYIQSPGPIFFSQDRVGKNGRTFKIYKFRTMYPDAEARKKDLMSKNKMKGLMFKIDDDPRIIPIGKFLRKTSIDELPQSINILRHDMSLVGTRPPTLDEYEHYEIHHKTRLAATPGLTGMWQVSGRSNITDFEEVVKLDSEYIKNWSVSLDIKIIFKTIRVVLMRAGSV